MSLHVSDDDHGNITIRHTTTGTTGGAVITTITMRNDDLGLHHFWSKLGHLLGHTTREQIREALTAAERGESEDLGDLSQYLEGTEETGFTDG
jgi:hypothetical protein